MREAAHKRGEHRDSPVAGCGMCQRRFGKALQAAARQRAHIPVVDVTASTEDAFRRDPVELPYRFH